MQTVEKQVVLEENWQVLAVVFPPFAQRLENSVSRACWPGSMSLGVFHLIGSFVRYKVTEEGWELSAATPEEVDAHYASSRPALGSAPLEWTLQRVPGLT